MKRLKILLQSRVFLIISLLFLILYVIFLTKIINLEEIYIQIKKEEDKILLELSENNNEQYDERFEIKKEEVDEDNIFRSYKDSNRFKLFS